MIALATLSPNAPQLRGAVVTLYDGGIRGTCGARRGGVHPRNMAFQSKRLMTEARDRTDTAQGIEGVLLANRDRIVRFLQLRGAGDAAEDLFQDLWMRLTERASGPVADPLPYVMRAANNLMLDRYRSARQRELRDAAWGDVEANLLRRLAVEGMRADYDPDYDMMRAARMQSLRLIDIPRLAAHRRAVKANAPGAKRTKKAAGNESVAGAESVAEPVEAPEPPER